MVVSLVEYFTLILIVLVDYYFFRDTLLFNIVYLVVFLVLPFFMVYLQEQKAADDRYQISSDSNTTIQQRGKVDGDARSDGIESEIQVKSPRHITTDNPKASCWLLLLPSRCSSFGTVLTTTPLTTS